MDVTISDARQKLFWSKVDKTDSCWIWKLSKDKDGYGKVRLNNIDLRAHRVSFALTFLRNADGTFNLPDRKLVCHKCDNPPCVNPDHLFLGTVRDNVLDLIAKGKYRSNFSYPKHGERNPAAKLKESEVISIRELYAKGGISQRKVAKMFGMSQVAIGEICRRESWIHV